MSCNGLKRLLRDKSTIPNATRDTHSSPVVQMLLTALGAHEAQLMFLNGALDCSMLYVQLLLCCGAAAPPSTFNSSLCQLRYTVISLTRYATPRGGQTQWCTDYLDNFCTQVI